MNICGYGVAGTISGYGTQSISQTSSKYFTIPVWGEDIAKTNNITQKNGNNDKINNDKTNPFEAGSFNFNDWCSKLDPNYDCQMFTKTEPTKSDEEILKDIIELAKKHAQQGTFQENDEEFLALRKEYISSVSPNREGILNSAMNEIIERTKKKEDYTMSDIYQQVKSQTADKKEEEEKELIDYFIEALESKGNGKGSSGTVSNIKKNGDYYEINIDNDGGKTTTLSYDANGKLMDMYIGGNNYNVRVGNNGSSAENGTLKDDNGNMIAAFGRSQGQDDFRFHSCPTDAEWVREHEFSAAYNAGYDFANGIYRPPPNGSAYKEAYESNYNRLMNNAVV